MAKRKYKRPASPTARTVPRCRLLELPAELRSQIWSYAVAKDYSIPLAGNRDGKKDTGDAIKRPGFVQCNRQIRSEALSIYFSQNIFEIHDEGDDETFDALNQEPGLVIEWVRRLCVHGAYRIRYDRALDIVVKLSINLCSKDSNGLVNVMVTDPSHTYPRARSSNGMSFAQGKAAVARRIMARYCGQR